MAILAGLSAANPLTRRLIKEAAGELYRYEGLAVFARFEPHDVGIDFVGPRGVPQLRAEGRLSAITPFDGDEWPLGIESITFDETESVPMSIDYLFTTDQIKDLVDKGLYEEGFTHPEDMVSRFWEMGVLTDMTIIPPVDQDSPPLAIVDLMPMRSLEMTRDNSGYDLSSLYEDQRALGEGDVVREFDTRGIDPEYLAGLSADDLYSELTGLDLSMRSERLVRTDPIMEIERLGDFTLAAPFELENLEDLLTNEADLSAQAIGAAGRRRRRPGTTRAQQELDRMYAEIAEASSVGEETTELGDVGDLDGLTGYGEGEDLSLDALGGDDLDLDLDELGDLDTLTEPADPAESGDLGDDRDLTGLAVSEDGILNFDEPEEGASWGDPGSVEDLGEVAEGEFERDIDSDSDTGDQAVETAERSELDEILLEDLAEEGDEVDLADEKETETQRAARRAQQAARRAARRNVVAQQQESQAREQRPLSERLAESSGGPERQDQSKTSEREMGE